MSRDLSSYVVANRMKTNSLVVDGDKTDAFVVRKNGGGADLFEVDTVDGEVVVKKADGNPLLECLTASSTVRITGGLEVSGGFTSSTETVNNTQHYTINNTGTDQDSGYWIKNNTSLYGLFYDESQSVLRICEAGENPIFGTIGAADDATLRILNLRCTGEYMMLNSDSTSVTNDQGFLVRTGSTTYEGLFRDVTDGGWKLASISGGVGTGNLTFDATTERLTVGGLSASTDVVTATVLTQNLVVRDSTSDAVGRNQGVEITSSTTDEDNCSGRIFFRESGADGADSNYGFSLAYESGANTLGLGLAANEFGIVRHDNDAVGSAALKFERENGNALFTGTVGTTATGLASAPALRIGATANTGLYQSASDRLNIGVSGLAVASFFSGRIEFHHDIRVQPGNVSAPGMSFDLDSDTGIYQPDATARNNIAIAVGGVQKLHLDGSVMEVFDPVEVTGTGQLMKLTSNSGGQSLLAFFDSTTESGYLGVVSDAATDFILGSKDGRQLQFISDSGVIECSDVLEITPAGTASVPAVEIGGGVGFYEASANSLGISTGGTGRVIVESDFIGLCASGTTVGNTGSGIQLSTEYIDSGNSSSRIFLRERTSGLYGFSLAYEGGESGDPLGLALPPNVFSIQRHNDSAAGVSALAVERNTGYIGVNTDNPGTNFHVLKSGTPESNSAFTAMFQNSETTSSACRVSLVSGVTGSAQLDFGDTADHTQGAISYSNNAESMFFQTGGSTAMTIDGSGRVGIGNSSPGSYNSSADDLVVGSTDGTHGITILNSSGATSGGIYFADGQAGDAPYRGRLVYNQSASVMSLLSGSAGLSTTYDGITTIYRPTGTSTANAFRVGSSIGDSRFIVMADGDALNINNSYGGISDQRIKQDIGLASSQWADIKALGALTKNFKLKADVRANGSNALQHLGWVAQDVETISPALVVKQEKPEWMETDIPDELNDPDDPESGLTEESSTYRAVKTSILFIKSVKALSEAMVRIETLEAENTTQASAITALETENATQAAAIAAMLLRLDALEV